MREEGRVTNQELTEADEFFISELHDRIKTYEHKCYEKNGYTYFRFTEYSVRLNTEFFESIKSKLYDKAATKKETQA